MSHHKHTTVAFILAVTPSREHDARIKLVTKDGEVLAAIATGLRRHTSKLRMALQPYMQSSISLVKGKDAWRITNAQSIRNYFIEIQQKEGRKALARTVSLCERLTPGESYIGNIFSVLVTYAEILCADVPREKITICETQAALHILSELGYIENVERWNSASIEYIEEHLNDAVRDINRGIQSTHLM